MVKARKPVRVRRINIVSILMALAVASAIYFGWKIIPVYYEAQKVDTLLQGYRREASEIQLHKIDAREKRILEEVWQKVTEMGIDDPEMEVYFSEDYSSLPVDYSVEVRFFFGKSTTLQFERSVEVPRDDI